MDFSGVEVMDHISHCTEYLPKQRILQPNGISPDSMKSSFRQMTVIHLKLKKAKKTSSQYSRSACVAFKQL